VRKLQIIEEGRRQRAEGFVQMGIQTPPEREPPNFQFGGGLKPLLPPVAQTVRAIGEGINPLRSTPLPFAFLDNIYYEFPWIGLVAGLRDRF
jgi:hypothetical protein